MSWPNADDMEPGDVISILGVDHVFYLDEMRTSGTPSWKNNNPGNIVHFKGEAEGYGAYPGKHNDIFAIFPDEATGFEAVRSFLRRRSDKSILEMMQIYAPAGHGPNDPTAYAQQIADALGVTTDTKVSALGEDGLTTFAQRVQQVEGWNPGETYGPDTLPDDVSTWLSTYPTRADRDGADQPFAQQGGSGAGVANLQRLLNQSGADPQIAEDGQFGPGTAKAVSDFQAAHGMSADGIAGNKTWRALTGQ